MVSLAACKLRNCGQSPAWMAANSDWEISRHRCSKSEICWRAVISGGDSFQTGGVGRLGAAAEHFRPAIAEHAQAGEDFLDGLAVFGQIALAQATIEITVKRTEVLGHFAAFAHVEIAIQLIDDGLGAKDIVVDG